jgi:glycosyltransferase involved in cell wall biosynthesis
VPEATVDRVVVVIPARDEQELIADAVVGATVAISRLPAGVRGEVVVVANGCSDDTIGRARTAGAVVLAAGVANVGAARAVGCEWALTRWPWADRLWICTTDADSVVPPGWLTTHVGAADAGADAVAGTIELSPEHAATHARWVEAYQRCISDSTHGHVHGANLGFRGSAYRRAGGFRPLLAHEDVELVGRLAATGATIVRTSDVPVRTSARHVSRVGHGVGPDLAASVAATVPVSVR